MAKNPRVKDLYEMQSDGYPMDQVLIIESAKDENSGPMVCAFFADAEMDVFMVEYSVSGDVVIHADALSHIVTNADQLRKIASLEDEARSLNEELEKYFTDEGDYSGYAHLITRPTAI